MKRPRNAALMLLIVAGPFAVLAAGVLLVRGRPPRPPEAIGSGALDRANVLLLTVDALRNDHLGAYTRSGSLSGAIDQFAKEGLYFARAYSQVPVDSLSHRTLMKGAYPHHLDPTDTLALRLQAAGYRTGAFVGSSDLAANSGLALGFDEYNDAMPSGGVSRNAEAVFGAALQWLNPPPPRPAPPDPRPWFCWVNVSDPNAPYQPPEPFRSNYSAEGYDGEVAYVDSAFLSFVTSLRAAGVFDNTLVVITAPYGESLGEHGEPTHGSLAYDSTLRVPLIIWAKPAIAPGIFTDTMRLVDVTPTILDLLGLPPLDGIDGRSIRPFFGGAQPFDNRESYFEINGMKGMVKGGHKLIVSRTPEYFDLIADPEEARNLYLPTDPNIRAMEQELEEISRR